MLANGTLFLGSESGNFSVIEKISDKYKTTTTLDLKVALSCFIDLPKGNLFFIGLGEQGKYFIFNT
jgi:hypothetical protein